MVVRRYRYTLLLLIAFGAVGPSRHVFAEEEVLFRKLTNNVWLQGPLVRLKLTRQGTYRWTRVSDYVEKDDRGRWGLTAIGENSGLLHLSSGSVIRFEMRGEKLLLPGSEFRPGRRIEYSDEDSTLASGNLKPVPLPDDWKTLASTPWKKANDFDDYRTPDRIAFHTDGRYVASYRGGECREEGSWSLFGEPVLGLRQPLLPVLVLFTDGHRCDQRGAVAAAVYSHSLRWIDDVLVIHDCYYPVQKKTDANQFVLDYPYGHVRTRGAYRGALRKGVPTVISLIHENVDRRDKELVFLEVSMQRVQIGMQGAELLEKPIVVVRKDFEDVRLARGEIHAHDIEVTPPLDGDVWIDVHFRYRDSVQPFNSRRGFSVRIGDPPEDSVP